MFSILAIPGSLRDNSSSNAILRIIAQMVPDDVTFSVYDGIGTLPHFNDAEEIPVTVIDFRDRLRKANAVLICTPEYAFGIPGSLKNALDWTVSSGEFVDKPVALVTASSQGEKGHAALLLVLKAISAKVDDEATLLISFVRAKLDKEGDLKDALVREQLEKVVKTITTQA